MGCVYETSFDMACFEPMLLIPYEFISPDNNGLNDRWIIQWLGLPRFDDPCVQPLGGLVFEHQGPYMNTWDGTNMRGEPLLVSDLFLGA